jgi:hypothetical protein
MYTKCGDLEDANMQCGLLECHDFWVYEMWARAEGTRTISTVAAWRVHCTGTPCHLCQGVQYMCYSVAALEEWKHIHEKTSQKLLWVECSCKLLHYWHVCQIWEHRGHTELHWQHHNLECQLVAIQALKTKATLNSCVHFTVFCSSGSPCLHGSPPWLGSPLYEAEIFFNTNALWRRFLCLCIIAQSLHHK